MIIFSIDSFFCQEKVENADHIFPKPKVNIVICVILSDQKS